MSDLVPYSAILEWLDDEGELGWRARLAFYEPPSSENRVGSLSRDHLSEIAPVKIAEEKRTKHGREYHPVFQRHLGRDYPRLEIKVDGRFKPCPDLWAERVPS